MTGVRIRRGMLKKMYIQKESHANVKTANLSKGERPGAGYPSRPLEGTSCTKPFTTTSTPEAGDFFGRPWQEASPYTKTTVP